MRRLAEQFNSVGIKFARGLPWAYTGMGVLRKHGGRKKRDAVPVNDATEEEVLDVSRQIGLGLATPALTGSVTPRPGASMPRPQTVPLTSGFKAPVRIEEGSTKRKYEDLVIPSGGILIQGRWASPGEIPSRGSQAASSEDAEERKRKFDDSKAAQSKKEDKEISGEDHGVKRSAEEIAEGSPNSERLFPPSYAGGIKRVKREYVGDDPEIRVTNIWGEVELFEEELKDEMKNEGDVGDGELPPELPPEELAASQAGHHRRG